MRKFPKPNVVISECLEFTACRYNGQIVHDSFVKKLAKFVNYFPICPEVSIGLGIPRFPVRLVSVGKATRLIQPTTGKDVTEDMNRFSKTWLEKLKGVDGFILKFRSPSCGIKDVRIYAKAEKSPAVGRGPGLFASHVNKYFAGLAIEDEGRLMNLKIREHFLTKLFTLATFREIHKELSISTLAKFHAENKFLLMAYGQNELKVLGNIVANHNRKPEAEVFDVYGAALKASMSSPPKRSANINVLMHLSGYFSSRLSKNEKEFFSETLGLYREGRIPHTSAVALLKGWTIRFQDEYLGPQTLFEPIPRALLDWIDGGRPIEV
jgi:uncharacterized protein YbgA (DUF1722 family)/uncharacterized protein YbbK (DUF523 family)